MLLPQEGQNMGVLPMIVKATDYVRGAATGIPFESRNQIKDWRTDKPEKEYQRRNFETWGCVSFSSLNTSVETQLNFALRNNLLSASHVNFLTQEGYLVNGKVNCSDRYLIIVSGTTKNGNSGSIVADSTRKFGFIPEADLPWGGNTWEEYMTPPPNMAQLILKGQRFLNYFDVQYEWVRSGTFDPDSIQDLVAQLEHAPLQLFIPVGADYNRTDGQPIFCNAQRTDHAVTMLAGDPGELACIFDSYNPFDKQLAKGYFIPWALKYVVTPKEIETVANQTVNVSAYRINFKGRAGILLDYGQTADLQLAANQQEYADMGKRFAKLLGGRVTCVPDGKGGWTGFQFDINI